MPRINSLSLHLKHDGGMPESGERLLTSARNPRARESHATKGGRVERIKCDWCGKEAMTEVEEGWGPLVGACAPVMANATFCYFQGNL